MMQRTILALLFVSMLLGSASLVNAAEKTDLADRIKDAEKLIKSKSFENALLIIDKILEEDAEYGPALFQRAVALENSEKIPEAIEAYNQCIEILNKQKSSAERDRILKKAKRAVLDLDKSKRIILEYADKLEREAVKFKKKDSYTYEKLMKVVENMRGPWQKDENSETEIKKVLKERLEAFFAAIIKQNYDDALPYTDPYVRRAIGNEGIKKHLRILGDAYKTFQIEAVQTETKTITLSRDLKAAKVIYQNKTKNGTWVDSKDPSYWILKDGVWYIGDEKVLAKEFKD